MTDRGAILACLGTLLLTFSGCQPAVSPPTGSASTISIPSGRPEASSPSGGLAGVEDPVLDTRLFGRVAFTARPRAVFVPLDVKSPPRFEKDDFAWNPQATVERWVADFGRGELQFRFTIHDADGLFPSLKGATVADVGAAYGNNLFEWQKMLGPGGRLVETEVDGNAARFMAYVANKKGYGERVMVIHNRYDNPCLPKGQFDLVLCSYVHSHITVGRNPRSADSREFYAESKVFLGGLRQALKNDNSLLIVIEGMKSSPSPNPKDFYLYKDEAIANIENNGFKVVGSKQDDRRWTAAFRKAP